MNTQRLMVLSRRANLVYCAGLSATTRQMRRLVLARVRWSWAGVIATCPALLLLLTLLPVVTGVASTNGLLAAYGFSENAGPATADASGNNVSGTINSATWT